MDSLETISKSKYCTNLLGYAGKDPFATRKRRGSSLETIDLLKPDPRIINPMRLCAMMAQNIGLPYKKIGQDAKNECSSLTNDYCEKYSVALSLNKDRNCFRAFHVMN